MREWNRLNIMRQLKQMVWEVWEGLQQNCVYFWFWFAGLAILRLGLSRHNPRGTVVQNRNQTSKIKRAKPSRSLFQKPRAELIAWVPADLLAGFNVARFTALLLNGVLVVVVGILGFETGLMCQFFKLGVILRFLPTLRDFVSTVSGRSRCTDPRHPCMLGFELRVASSLRCCDQPNLILFCCLTTLSSPIQHSDGCPRF